MSTDVDTVLGGRYRLAARIAGGGMGEVWLAQDTVLHRDVAIKILRSEYADDPTFLARFQAEARHAAGLSHPHIATVYDFGEGGADDSPFLVMEYVPGEALSDLLSGVSRSGRLPARQTLEIIGQAALGLQAAHDAGVIHRDVKPGNILVTPEGVVKITDFGIARATNAVPLTRTGAIMGTAFYISPEQASGRPVEPASDVYSLGIVAYECLTGSRPFPGDTPVSVALAQVNQQPPALPGWVPAPVRELVMAMLAKEPSARPAGAGDLGRQALALAASLPVQDEVSDADTLQVAAAGTPDPVTRLRTDTDPGFLLPPPDRPPRRLLLGALLLVGLLAVAGLVRACSSPDSGTTGAGAASGSAGTTGSVTVVPAAFIGRPVESVRTDLRNRGLRVRVVLSEGGGVVGTVKGVSPRGDVATGGLVVVRGVAAPPTAPPSHGKAKGKHKKDNGGGPGEGD